MNPCLEPAMSSALANILFVDDDPSVRQALARSLRNEAFRQIWTENSDGALSALARESIDVVVADDRMPGLTGAELVATIAQQDPDIVTILFSGQPSVGSVALALNSGRIFRLLLKPCHTEVIVGAVQEAIAFRRERLRAKRVEAIARLLADRFLPGNLALTEGDVWLDTVEHHFKSYF